MKQDKSLQSANGHAARAAQVTEAKARQRENALLRSKTDIRRTSSASTENAQSEVTERPPALYQVPPINVPDNLHDCAKLIHSELTKIANSQSVLLSLWEKVKDQANTAGTVEFKKAVAVDGDFAVGGSTTFYGDAHIANSLWADIQSNSWLAMWLQEFDSGSVTGGYPYHLSAVPHAALPQYSINGGSGGGIQIANNCDTAPPNSTVFCYSSSLNSPGYECTLVTYGSLGGGYMGQLAFGYAADQLSYRTRNGDNGSWLPWHQLALLSQVEKMRSQLKREIYAELMELNAGIVVPVVIE